MERFSFFEKTVRLDYQPLFGKGARASRGGLTRHERAAEIEPRKQSIKVRRISLEVQVTSEHKLCTKITDIVRSFLFELFCLNISSKEIICCNFECPKQVLKLVWNTWNYWQNESMDGLEFTWVAKFLGTLKFISLSFHWQHCFWYKVHVHLKLKRLDFLSDSVSQKLL